MDGVDGALHDACHVAVEGGLAKPLQAGPQRLRVNMRRHYGLPGNDPCPSAATLFGPPAVVPKAQECGQATRNNTGLIAHPCPAVSPYCGEWTPAVREWDDQCWAAAQ